MARMTDKTWAEAVNDAHARPWWVDELITEAKRARESEARLAELLGALTDPKRTATEQAIARQMAIAALKAAEDGTP